MKAWLAAIAVAAVFTGTAHSEQASRPTWEHLRAGAVAHCSAIDPGEYQTGLLFNPDGYRTYYVQSECYQRVAEEFRDATLCAMVRERKSLFLSSWGYSKTRCEALVAQGVAVDRKTLEDLKVRYSQGPVTLTGFRVERNGNGRDFDIIPAFSKGLAHSYSLTFSLAETGAVILSDGFHLSGADNLRLYVPRTELRRRAPQLNDGESRRVRASLTLDVGSGTPGGRWSDAFIEQVFPARARTQHVEALIQF